jgi:predicted enzyme related to lactoylglutathione lyase
MTSETAATHKFSHFGICVTDLGRSLRFYCGALGFTVAEVYQVGNEVGRTMELDNVNLRSQFIRRPDGISLELLYYDSPACFGSRERRPMNQYGITHMSFYVTDLEAALREVRECGGTVHGHTRTDTGFISLIYCTDPDGVRVELMQACTAA